MTEEEQILRERQARIEREEKEIKEMVRSEIIENKHIYEKLLELEKLIRGEEGVKFKNVEEWKKYIWDNCEFKKTIEKGDVIVHECEKLKAACHFIDCPLNKK